MEIRKVPISLLNAAPYNPRKDLQPVDPEYQKIARSIEKYGCVEPIIWNEKTGNVIGGHQRLKVLAATGAVEVDVSVVQLSLEDAAYRYHHRAVSSESLSGAAGYALFLFLHKKCRPPLTASCSVRSVFRLPV